MKPDPIDQAMAEIAEPPIPVFDGNPPLDLDDPVVRLDLEEHEHLLLPPVGTPEEKIDRQERDIPIPGTRRYDQARRRQEQMRSHAKYLAGESEFAPLSIGDEPGTPAKPFKRDDNWCVRAYKDVAKGHGIGVASLVCHFVAWTRTKYEKDGRSAHVWDTLENFARPLECSVSSLKRYIRAAVLEGFILARRQRRSVRLQVHDKGLFKKTDPDNVVYSPRVVLRHLGFYPGAVLSILHRYSRESVFDVHDEVVEAGQGYATTVAALAKKLGIGTRAARHHVQVLLDLGLATATPEGCFIDSKRYRVPEAWVQYDLKDPDGSFDKALRDLLGKPQKVRGEFELSAANLSSHTANLTSSTANLSSHAANLTSSPSLMINPNGSTESINRHKQRSRAGSAARPLAGPGRGGAAHRDGPSLRSESAETGKRKEDPEPEPDPLEIDDLESHLEQDNPERQAYEDHQDHLRAESLLAQEQEYKEAMESLAWEPEPVSGRDFPMTDNDEPETRKASPEPSPKGESVEVKGWPIPANVPRGDLGRTWGEGSRSRERSPKGEPITGWSSPATAPGGGKAEAEEDQDCGRVDPPEGAAEPQEEEEGLRINHLKLPGVLPIPPEIIEAEEAKARAEEEKRMAESQLWYERQYAAWQNK